jgi:hypothetical protein
MYILGHLDPSTNILDALEREAASLTTRVIQQQFPMDTNSDSSKCIVQARLHCTVDRQFQVHSAGKVALHSR